MSVELPDEGESCVGGSTHTRAFAVDRPVRENDLAYGVCGRHLPRAHGGNRERTEGVASSKKVSAVCDSRMSMQEPHR